MGYGTGMIASVSLMAVAMPLTAWAAPASPLLQLDRSSLKEELRSRYDAAVAAAGDPATRAAQDSRFTWAVEGKNQCGIALGFLKSGTKDADSINKCDAFVARLSATPPPPASPAPPALPALDCVSAPAVSIFFDWNQDVPLPEGADTISTLARSAAQCGWGNLTATGYTDTSGTTVYNDGLSLRRARNVASMLEQAGVAPGSLAVEGRGETQLKIETADGVREPMNRRVEVTATSAQ
ncbi:Outer membrane protein OmpA [Sphingobium faniae]|nr:Outer membrane protein OmpA [Sphingobium faniae]